MYHSKEVQSPSLKLGPTSMAHGFEQLDFTDNEQQKNLGGLRSTRNVSINEQVAIFLIILSHHTKNRVVKPTFIRSRYTISKHFNNVLNTLLKLYTVLLVKPVSVPEDSTDNRWRYFKITMLSHYLIDRLVTSTNTMDGSTNLNLGGRVRKRVVPTSRCVWTYAEELELVGALKDLVVKTIQEVF
ncbi:hypothetical protein ACS0TY_021513 [Phlomoides rotata]